MKTDPPWLIDEEVRAALAAGAPVVALETALLTHGLPHPWGVETTAEAMQAVREEGAVPAPIALLDGRIRVGLEQEELARLASEPARRKASVRDLAALLAARAAAGTTVAATLYLAHRLGLRFLATGGLGGVHRGGERSLDISADLAELRRSPLVVVCSGIKSLLDLPRTLEVLETLGVPLLGYRCTRLPGFYLHATDHPVPQVAGPEEALATIALQDRLGWPASLVLANPPPLELALEPGELETLLAGALADARARGIRGAETTPFLLAHLARASGGRTLALNRALVVANARLAAGLARAWRDRSP